MELHLQRLQLRACQRRLKMRCLQFAFPVLLIVLEWSLGVKRPCDGAKRRQQVAAS